MVMRNKKQRTREGILSTDLMVSYAQDPGVSDKSGSGIGRLGNGLPVLEHVLAVVAEARVEDDFAMVENLLGANASAVNDACLGRCSDSNCTNRTSFMVHADGRRTSSR